MRQEHPLLAQPQFHLTKLSKNETTKPFVQESIGNSGLSIYSDVAPAAIGRTKGSICLVGVKGKHYLKHYALTAWHVVDGCDSQLTPTAYRQACARAEDSSHRSHLKEKKFFIKRDEQYVQFGQVKKASYGPQVDAAALQILQENEKLLRCHESPPTEIRPHVSVEIADEVSFVGATSGITKGRLFLSNHTLEDEDLPPLRNAFVFCESEGSIQPTGGDSGGLWFVERDEIRIPLALHRGRYELDEMNVSIANTIDDALKKLELQGITACHSGICQCGDPTRLESEGEEEVDVEESEEDEDEDEDGDEKELQAQWLQVLTSAEVRLGAKSKSTYAQILARNGLSPSRINNAAADEKHPLLQSMGSPFDKAVNRLNLIEGLARAAQPTPNS